MTKLEHKKIDVKRLVHEIESARRIDDSGSVTFEGWSTDDPETVLISCAQFSIDLPDIERRNIFYKALFAAGARGTITKESLERELGRLEKSFLQQPKKPYVVVTSMSVQHNKAVQSARLDSCTITFSRKRPVQFDRSELMTRLRRDVDEPEPKDFMSVRVRLDARSTHEAGQQATDALDFVRGMWNFALNYPVISRDRDGRPTPINEVRLGPIHTLHQPNGKLANTTYWYEPFFVPQIAKRLSADEWARMKHYAGAFRRSIQRLPYGKDMRDVFIRYARALDTADLEKSYLKLWALLETLTNSGGQHDTTIRRAACLWSDLQLNRAILEHLRIFRNATVHEGLSTQRVETFTFQLKRYVEELIFFHLTAKPFFKSLHDAGEYFDILREPAVLRKQLAMCERALRFRGVRLKQPRKKRSKVR